ncbi:paraquat-inducible protein A [Shewanella sp. SG44-2]|uniref:paraquat-inducible protein A n=1 Tax=Shewanella sp. SG44-2 TaxID=2760962 RepID=UPI00160251A8|nr:paraquat-inducible protein A [Shewanella sp. SG44-2]MBB1381969.1 paraquat-inducible protein A [Shewanella sp. SR41-2]MBB1425249.1 paraquat-inducible protein A [Shewanella sp. SG44-2]
MKVYLSISLVLISLILLIPGVTKPMLTITGTIEKSQLVDTGKDMLIQDLTEDSRANTRGILDIAASMLGLDTLDGEVEVFRNSRSIIDTIAALYQSHHFVVAMLIGLFSIVIPAVKLITMLILLLPVTPLIKQRLSKMISVIGKWSMADVFVVAIIVTYMAGNASAGMGDMLKTQSQFEIGFYYFLGYCIFSIASQMMIDMTQTQKSQNASR